jgi:hypothetical protein
MDKVNIHDPRQKTKPRQNRAGYSAPPEGLSGAELAAWAENQHKLRQEELAAAPIPKKTEPTANPLDLPLPPPVIRSLPPVAQESKTVAEAKNGPVTATVAPGTLETTSTLAPPTLNTRVIQESYKETYKEIYKGEYKSDRRVPGSPAVSGVAESFSQHSKPDTVRANAEPEINWAARLQLSSELAAFEKSAKAKPDFRLRFDLGRLLKFARQNRLDDSKIRGAAAGLMILWEDVEAAAEQVRQNLNEDAFQTALAMGQAGVPGLDAMDPALRPVAALAFQLQVVAGTSSTIYLVQTKIAQAFQVSQPAVSRVLFHLKKAKWLEEVEREKRGRKDFVRYRCPPAIAHNVPVEVEPGADAVGEHENLAIGTFTD